MGMHVQGFTETVSYLHLISAVELLFMTKCLTAFLWNLKNNHTFPCIVGFPMVLLSVVIQSISSPGPA